MLFLLIILNLWRILIQVYVFINVELISDIFRDYDIAKLNFNEIEILFKNNNFNLMNKCVFIIY